MKNNSLVPEKSESSAFNIDSLCRNSIELIQHARKNATNQSNHTQLMTYYALGYWIVEEQQSGKDRAGYGKKIIQTLSHALNAEFGRGFSADTLENARKFYLNYQERISETVLRKFVEKKTIHCFGFRTTCFRLHCRGLIIFSLCESRIRKNADFMK